MFQCPESIGRLRHTDFRRRNNALLASWLEKCRIAIAMIFEAFRDFPLPTAKTPRVCQNLTKLYEISFRRRAIEWRLYRLIYNYLPRCDVVQTILGMICSVSWPRSQSCATKSSGMLSKRDSAHHNATLQRISGNGVTAAASSWPFLTVRNPCRRGTKSWSRCCHVTRLRPRMKRHVSCEQVIDDDAVSTSRSLR